MSMNIHMNTVSAGLNVAYDNIVNGKWQETKTTSSYRSFKNCVKLSDEALPPVAKKVCKTALVALTAYVAYLTVPGALATIVSLASKAVIVGVGAWAAMNTFSGRINPVSMNGLESAEELLTKDVFNLGRMLRGERTSVYSDASVGVWDLDACVSDASINLNNNGMCYEANLNYNDEFGSQ